MWIARSKWKTMDGDDKTPKCHSNDANGPIESLRYAWETSCGYPEAKHIWRCFYVRPKSPELCKRSECFRHFKGLNFHGLMGNFEETMVVSWIFLPIPNGKVHLLRGKSSLISQNQQLKTAKKKNYRSNKLIIY